MDDPNVEKTFKQIVNAMPAMQNGLTADSMKTRGLNYEMNWGVSIVDLKNYSKTFEKNHLLALKLWNKKWRETMIMATLLDDPKSISEEQMDYWIKTAENIELIEQAVRNLMSKSPYAFVKALEWCNGKKFWVKYAGLMMMGRLALTAENDIDEMFELFFDVLPPLAKDKELYTVFFRSTCQLARHSQNLHAQTVSFAKSLSNFSEVNAQKLGSELFQELTNNDFQLLIKK